jgi:hypothetical protein
MQQNNWWIQHLWRPLEFLLSGIHFVSEQQVLGIQKPKQEHVVTQAVCNIYTVDFLSSQSTSYIQNQIIISLHKNHNKKKINSSGLKLQISKPK